MIDAHTLEILEFGRVLDRAARYASSPAGADWVRSLIPSTDAGEVTRRLDLTSEVRRLRTSPAGFSGLDFPDVAAALHALEAVGVVLEAAELKGLAAVAGLARRVRERLESDRADYPLVWEIASRLVPAPALERAVSETFGPHDDILDSASPMLKQVRRNLRQQRERIVNRLESLSHADPAKERTVTLRADRYVLGVRSSDKSEVGGIVHDRSGTGATVYLEPFGLVEENNRLIELLSDEREEVRRILAALSDLARGLRHGLGLDAELLTTLDGHRALAGLAEAQDAVPPRLTGGERLVLKAFRHPLLTDPSSTEARTVVPLDLELSGAGRILLVTGPNMGGKTVALKGVGLACVMAAVGMHLPAAPGTEVPVLGNLVADIGDEQSIANDLSTFASHLRRWIDATAAAGPRSLALLDEIGAGTDPSEGAALAQAVLERLADSGGLAMATTHLGALKRFASGHSGIVNGSMRFDPATERPLYVLDRGLPGQSRAIEMARRLGLPAPLVNRAADLVGREEQDVQALLSELEGQRIQLEQERSEVLLETRRSREIREKYEGRLHRLTDEYAALKARGIREGERLLDLARTTLKDAEKAAAEAARHGTGDAREAARRLAAAREQVTAVRESVDARKVAAEAPGSPVVAADIRAGERLWAAPLNTWVTVLQAPAGTDKVRVERNGVRVELPVSALRSGTTTDPGTAPAARPRAIDELPPDVTPAKKGTGFYETPEAVRGEVDLRGLTADEAITRLDNYLDGAMLGGLVEVRIIHGKGTGVLRQAVRKWLSGRPDIVSHRLGEMYEGGTGVTVARLE
jgi:DNA mismatch repair protein MutS2